MSRQKPKSPKSISQLLATFLSFGLFLYFGYHLSHGDHGYFAWKGLQEKIVQRQEKYDQKMQERVALENRVKRMRPNSLDVDMLDERARVVLGFVKPGEKVIITSGAN